MQKIDNTWESENQHYRYALMGGNLLIGTETQCKQQTSRQPKNYRKHSEIFNKNEGYGLI